MPFSTNTQSTPTSFRFYSPAEASSTLKVVVAREFSRGWAGGGASITTYHSYNIAIELTYPLIVSNLVARTFRAALIRATHFDYTMNEMGKEYTAGADPMRTVAAGFVGGRRLPISNFQRGALKLGSWISFQDPTNTLFNVAHQIAGFYAGGVIVEPPIGYALAAGTPVRFESACCTVRRADDESFKFWQTADGWRIEGARLISARPLNFTFSE